MPLPFLPGLILQLLPLLAVFVLPATADDELEAAVQALHEGGSSHQELVGHLENIVEYLRADDWRLVRPSPSGLTSDRQLELARVGVVDGLAAVLERPDPQLRALAAELVHLLTTNNPANREALGTAGVIPPLVHIVAAGARGGVADEVVRGSEEAAEAFWILAFNGGFNHESFAAHDAAPALASCVLKCPSAKSRMWAGAAIGNLAANYENVPRETSEKARAFFIKYPGLVEALVQMVGQGPVKPNEPNKWPSQATKNERFSESIMAWGAGQALKNLALSKASHGPIKQANGVAALCKIKESPDWLEKMKGELTLHNLGASCTSEKEL